MKRITALDAHTINKIAAGEVVERPASVVKELVENAIDAQATHITVEIQEGGVSRIMVSDDGDGIYEGDVALAFERHATSKIQTIEDLEHLHSNGFRGEALSSIAAVARVELTSRQEDADFGTKAVVSDGALRSVEHVGAKKGTTIVVSDLFYNVPARKKFMKSVQSETTQITDLMSRLAIANPQIAMRYSAGGRALFDTAGDGDLQTAIAMIYGRSLARSLLPISYTRGDVKIYGYVSDTSTYQSNRKKEHIFINHRYIKLTPLTYVIENIYKGLIPIGKYPVFFVNIELAPEDVDPNVHPAKLEVKLSKDADIAGPLTEAVKEALFRASANLIPQASEGAFRYAEPASEIAGIQNAFDYEDVDVAQMPKEQREQSILHEPVVHPVENVTISRAQYESETDLSGNCEDIGSADYRAISQVEQPKTMQWSRAALQEQSAEYRQQEIAERSEAHLSYRSLQFVGIAFQTYIIVTQGNTLYLIDQHAAHERVWFERIRRDMRLGGGDALKVQELLTPDIKEFSVLEHGQILSNLPVFEALGFEIEDFGFQRIAVRAYPILFGAVQDKGLLEQVLELIQAERVVDLNETFLDKMASMACKKAIKAKQSIGADEVQLLFEQLDSCENRYTCPHGRPIFVALDQYQLEKMFKRVL